MDCASLFGNRCTTGELLFEMLGRIHDPLVYGLTVGAMEVAYPIAYLGCGSLRYLTRGFGVGELGSVAGPVVLADDGLTPVVDLVHAVHRLAGGGARSLVLAAPWFPRGLGPELPDGPEVRIVTLYDRPLPMRPLFDESDRPSRERVGWFLDAVHNHEHRELVRALASPL